MRFEYDLIDVFTDTPFGGNQLAVFPDATGLSEVHLQKIARELNLSETAFAWPREGRPAEWTLRIFTPTLEHPFAGHPTIGSALVLAARAARTGRAPGAIVLHEGVGAVDVEIHTQAGASVARLSVPVVPEVRASSLGRRELAEMLSVDETDLADGDWAPRTASCGVPFQFVCLKTVEAVARAKLRIDLWSAGMSQLWAPHMYVFARGAVTADAQIHSRMFAPLMGIAEDAATGGAAAALAGYLADAEPAPPGRRTWIIEQGMEMGRPSRLDLSADVANGLAHDVRIGGSGVIMGSGWLDLD